MTTTAQRIAQVVNAAHTCRECGGRLTYTRSRGTVCMDCWRTPHEVAVHQGEYGDRSESIAVPLPEDPRQMDLFSGGA